MFSAHPFTRRVPDQACLTMIRDKETHHRLRALVIELDMYGPKIEISDLQGSIAEEYLNKAVHQPNHLSHRGIEDMEADPIPHQDITIALPRSNQRVKCVNEDNNTVRVYFDGRCVKKLGAGGYVAFDAKVKFLGGQVLYFGNTA